MTAHNILIGILGLIALVSLAVTATAAKRWFRKKRGIARAKATKRKEKRQRPDPPKNEYRIDHG